MKSEQGGHEDPRGSLPYSSEASRPSGINPRPSPTAASLSSHFEGVLSRADASLFNPERSRPDLPEMPLSSIVAHEPPKPGPRELTKQPSESTGQLKVF